MHTTPSFRHGVRGRLPRPTWRPRYVDRSARASTTVHGRRHVARARAHGLARHARSMPVDIFPVIDIPVVAVVWNYNGFSAEDMESRIVLLSERTLSATVNGISRIESESIPGVGLIKIFFQPGVDIGNAIAQITSSSPDGAPRHAARGHAALCRPVQRGERPGRADHADVAVHAGAGHLRLRTELHPPPALHDPGPGHAVALRRQAPRNHRRCRSESARGQGPVGRGRAQRPALVQPADSGRARHASATATTTWP